MTPQIERNIRKWVAKGLKIDSEWVIPANENAPDPRSNSTRQDPYATVLLVNEKSLTLAEDEVEHPREDHNSFPVTGEIRYTEYREAIMQVSIFRVPNREQDLLSYINSESSRNLSYNLGFRVMDIATRVVSEDSNTRMANKEMGMVFDLKVGYNVKWNEGMVYPQELDVNISVS